MSRMSTPTNAPGSRQPIVFEMMRPLIVHIHSGHLLRSALELGLPDMIGDEPTPISQIALDASLDPDIVHRLLRALAGIGFFRLVGDDSCVHNEQSSLLRSDCNTAASAMIDTFIKSQWMWRVWDRLSDAVRTGNSPFSAVHGKSFYEYITTDAPEVAESFNAAMTMGLGQTNSSIVEVLDLQGTGKIVDVGGGQGNLLRDLLWKNTNHHGVLFDIKPALTEVDSHLRTGPLARRCEIVVGDARESVPRADAYLLRNILHNWDDENCVRILANCAQAGEPGTRIFVVEALRDTENTAPSFVDLMDLQMFLLFGGKERSESEYADLFERSELHYIGSSATASPFHIMEARLSL